MPREMLKQAAPIGVVTVLTITIGMVGAWAATRYVRPATHLTSGIVRVSPGPSPTASPSASPPPTQTAVPDDAQISAPSTKVAWALMADDALLVSTDQGITWVKRSLPMPFEGVRPMISFIDDREGWYLAPGSPATQCQEASADVWHTADGATTWQRLNISGIASSQCKGGIYFVDAKRGFITASDPNHPPTIYRTSDGGNTWTASTLPDPPDFKSTGAGYVLSAGWIKAFGQVLYLEAHGAQDTGPHDRFYVFRSTDGGATWQWLTKVPSLGLAMVTDTRWIILATPGSSLETTNGGQQWHLLTSDYSQAAPDAAQIVFPDALVGYATVRGVIKRTSDGGAHWTPVQIPGFGPQPAPPPTPGSIPMPAFAQLSAPSTKVVWALVAGQYLFISTDQATTWQARTLPAGAGNPLISFVDNLSGFVIYRADATGDCATEISQLWSTTDGAHTWQLVNALWDHECKDALYFSDAQHGFLATGTAFNVATIWTTVDGGHTWFAAPPAANHPAPRVFSFRAFGSTVLAYAPPFVYRSTDGGQTWSYVTQSPKSSKSLGFVSASRWIELISPDSSSETTDGGQSWHTLFTDYSQAAPIAPQIVFADSNLGYATVRGAIQRTANGGAHWEMIKTSWP